MPATESTWRDQSLMHVFFGVTSLLMLVATVWMLAADHSREWKVYQRQFRDVEVWTTQTRIDEEKSQQFDAQEEELKAQVAEAQAATPDRGLIDDFITRVHEQTPDTDTKPIDDAYKTQSEQPSIAHHQQLLKPIDKIVAEAKRVENNLQRQVKFSRAELDVKRSDYERAIGEGQPQTISDAAQAKVVGVQEQVDKLTLELQDAKTHRVELEAIVAKIIAPETLAQKRLSDHGSKVDQLKKAEEDARLSWWPPEKLLELPILDAFGRPLKVDQIWLPNLTINNNFRDVARFDRCTTCHLGIDKTAPGSGVEPGYPHEEWLNTSLATPAEEPPFAPAAGEAAPAAPPAEGAAETTAAATAAATPPAPEKRPVTVDEKIKRIEQVFGLRIAKTSLDPADVAIEIVWPDTPAAIAKLRAGDVLSKINGVQLDLESRELNLDVAIRYLNDNVRWGQPINIEVRRGQAHPFSTHPRLDLFVGALSPHKMADVGCTICHDGQGSATEFNWASHTPNTPAQKDEWSSKYGYFENHHWIYPITPSRFAESTCLKCHHEVVELEPSERFPDPPAEKLVDGYNLIRRYGCFGCHEINGYNGPNKRIGPDLRAEPNIAFAAQQLLIDPGLTTDERKLAERVAAHPESDADRKYLAQLLKGETTIGDTGTVEVDAPENTDAEAAPRLTPTTLRMAGILGADYESPGQLRKVGPSLRHVASKVDFGWLYNWIRNPQSFRPSTRMPKFFGLWNHLQPEPKTDVHGRPITEEHVTADGRRELVPVMDAAPGLEQAEQYEPVEIYATAKFLLASSQKFDYATPLEGVAEASVERGKKVLEQRGCLACHSHQDFPEIKQDQGPDLSRLGSKLTTPDGKKWLYSWVREPNRYHTRTVMPNVFLEKITGADGTSSDPAADVTAYLLSSQGWTGEAVPEVIDADLDALALEHLSNTFTLRQAVEFLKTGIPESMAGELKGDEVMLVGPMSREKKIGYVGRRTISKLGCAGCHDIPGFEEAKPIGTALADWGRKDPSKLAFEQIARYMEVSHGGLDMHSLAGAHGAEDHNAAGHNADGHTAGKHLDSRLGDAAAHAQEEELAAATGHGLSIQDMDPNTGFYMERLLGHQREGFIWQKLREPRSYDYKKTENKSYNERLRMPKFPFDQDQMEAVITFVLGLVAEPPRQQYVYQGKPRQQAIVAGRKVLDKFNCAGCHVLDMARWDIDYRPSDFSDPPVAEDFAFTTPHFTKRELEASKKTDRRGYGVASIHGWPVVDEQGNPITMEPEEEGQSPSELFTLWRSQPINGMPWLVGVTDMILPASDVTKKFPIEGGDLARFLYPRVYAEEKVTNPNAKPSDAWGWVPPPLVNEGRKVQTAWLHNFLLDPYPIRPAVVLRMPKFNMSSDEASQLVNYFAARDNVQYPYEFDPRTRTEHLASAEAEHPHRIDEALKLVTNRNFCVQCHLIGDFVPDGPLKGQAPNLDRVYQRIRPDFLPGWIANPKRYLPYTGMPVNFPPNKEVAQETFKGSSVDQIDAVVDLLLNFNITMEQRTSIKEIVPPPAAVPADGQPAADAAPPAGQ